MNLCEPLLPLLAWAEGSSTVLERLHRVRLSWIARNLGAQLASLQAASGTSELVAMWSALSLDAMDRIFRSPSICEAMRTGAPEAALRERVVAEFLIDRRSDARVNAWSALGDVWLGHSAPEPYSALMTLDADRRFVGPSLQCGIPIDLSLAADNEFPRSGVRTPKNPDTTCTAASVERLNSAVSFIRESSTAAFDAFVTLTSNIVLRVDEDAASRLQSASSAAALGRTVLVNAHASENSIALLAEFLVHEATHHAISVFELEAPLLVDLALARNIEVCSPWTGKQLKLHAFVHACLVWLSLFNYWTCVKRAGLAPVAADTRRQYIREGFRSLRAEHRLAPHGHHLNVEAMRLLVSLQERIVES